ncbi:MAG TPA: hypothetical protein VIL35_07905 [Vicinamibacterales bacterium]
MRRTLPAVLVGLLIVAAWWLWPSDTRRIRSLLDELVSAISVPAGESETQRALRLAPLARGLTEDVLLDAGDGVRAIRGREAVLGLASRLSALSGPTLIELTDVEVEIAEERTSATAIAIVRVRTGGDAVIHELDDQPIQVDLVKSDGTWRVRRAAPFRVLSR